MAVMPPMVCPVYYGVPLRQIALNNVTGGATRFYTLPLCVANWDYDFTTELHYAAHRCGMASFVATDFAIRLES